MLTGQEQREDNCVCASALAMQHFRRIYLNYNKFHYRIVVEKPYP